MIQHIKRHIIEVIIITVLFVLLVFSLFFSLERILSADTADYMVKLVNEPMFYAGSYRFIAYFTQFIPLLLIYLEAPFNLILQSYSFNLMLFHVAIILCILCYLKDIKSATVALLGILLTSTFLFYYPVTELQMGLTLSVFLYSYIQNRIIDKQANYLKYVIAILLLIAVIYSHPLAISFVGFMLAYLFLEQKINIKMFILCGLVVVAIFVSKYLLFTVINDSSNVNFLSNLKFFPLQSFLKFWGVLYTKMYLFLAVFLISIIALIIQKRWLILCFYLLFFYTNFYFSLSKWDAIVNWYSFHLCLPFFYIVIFVFVNAVFNKFSTNKYLFVMLPLVAISLIQIPDNKKFNQNRIKVIDKYVSAAINQNIQKGYVSPQEEGNLPNYWFWAIEYESLVLSKYKYNKTATLIYKNDDQMENIENQDDLFLTVWGSLPISYFDAKYFPFKKELYKKVRLEN